MERCGYLVYGENISPYRGCDAYGYAYNEVCSASADEPEADESERMYWSAARAQRCVEECEKRQLPCRVLYCQALEHDEKPVPPGENVLFLGFDVAWTEYDYFSSLLQEGIREQGALHGKCDELNAHGLFAELARARAYAKLRREMKAICKDGALEEGCFSVIAVWDCGGSKNEEGTEGNCEVFGVNIFQYAWKDSGKRAQTRDDLYHQRRDMPVYRAWIKGRRRSFAAGELSGGVWGFYKRPSLFAKREGKPQI